ncbi:MAG: hypothetical protein HYZ14_05585 [Bacteroidetes bacterium]|nr:hypothetical protein [Bacteroidota bacterium]
MKRSLIGFVVFVSCTGAPETAVVSASETLPDTAAVMEQPTERSSYEQGWINFKIAIEDKDGPAVASFIATESIDVEGLLDIFSDETYAQKLQNTAYDQLTDTVWEGIAVKEFRADIDYTDEDGNSYESAVFLYFEERETRLRLINVMMAG